MWYKVLTGSPGLYAKLNRCYWSVNLLCNLRRETGSSKNCPLFTCFIDETVKALKQTGPDSWLEDLHCLLLMDDTVIFASSRDKLKEKLCALKRCTDLLGMVIHPNKSKFISVIANDTEPVKIDDVSINFTTEYTYL